MNKSPQTERERVGHGVGNLPPIFSLSLLSLCIQFPCSGCLSVMRCSLSIGLSLPPPSSRGGSCGIGGIGGVTCHFFLCLRRTAAAAAVVVVLAIPPSLPIYLLSSTIRGGQLLLLLHQFRGVRRPANNFNATDRALLAADRYRGREGGGAGWT